MKSKRTGRPRAPAISRVVAGTIDGTTELVEELVHQSAHRTICWRPVRAAAALALGAQNASEGHVWMTPEEFAAWVERCYRSRPRVRLSMIHDDIGMTMERRREIEKGAPVSKLEALACAHLSAGLPMPVPADDPEAFAAWFTPRFAAAKAVAQTLGIAPRTLTNQLRGYSIWGGRRYRCKPTADIIRALDWCWRMGPISPYGQRPPVPAFPGQLTEV